MGIKCLANGFYLVSLALGREYITQLIPGPCKVEEVLEIEPFPITDLFTETPSGCPAALVTRLEFAGPGRACGLSASTG